MVTREYGQYDPVARGVELIGERWALLIVRDLLVGPRRFGELAAGLPRIPSNVLTARLKELQEAGVIRRAPRSRVVVYELTPYGAELEPIVLALGAWGFKAMTDPRDEQVTTPDAAAVSLRAAFRPAVAASLPATAYAARIGTAQVHARVDGRMLSVAPGEAAADLVFAVDAGIRHLLSGRLRPAEAVSSGIVRIVDGPLELLDRFTQTFHLASAA